MKFVSKLKTKLLGKTETHKGKSIKLKYAFTGASGYKYFYFPESNYHLNSSRYFDLFLPLQHEYLMKLNGNDLDLYLKECEKFTTVKQFQHANQALSIRRNIALDPMIIYQMMAVVYLREDEPNTLPSKELIRIKSEDIQQTMSGDGGETDFFQEPELKKFLSSLKLSGANMTLLSLHIERQSKLFKNILSEIQQKIR